MSLRRKHHRLVRAIRNNTITVTLYRCLIKVMKRNSKLFFGFQILSFSVFMLFGCMNVSASVSYSERKADLSAFFNKLNTGKYVTVVTLGGSITMHQNGWAQKTIELMRTAYPQATINFVNAGISGTGSNFGVFRLKRDVIEMRPDMVIIEYAVNDSDTDDTVCIRNLESIVSRLRGLPHPPALIFLESASESGVNQSRHNQVARHYGILDVDMQSVVDAYLTESGKSWSDLYSDCVHPNESGHALYAQTLWQGMQANIQLENITGIRENSNSPLSKQGLVLDACLLLPNFMQNGWDYQGESSQGWWGKYFQGTLQSGEDGSALHVPFYGRTIGVVLMTREGTGKLRIAVDGELINEIDAYTPNWFYKVYVHPELLEDSWHVLSLVPISSDDTAANVRIAYLLTEDQSNVPAIPADFWDVVWPESHRLTSGLSQVDWTAVSATDWSIAGPFGPQTDKPWEDPGVAMDLDYGLDPAQAPDLDQSYSGYAGRVVRLESGEGDGSWVNLGKMFGLHNRGVSYAYLRLKAEHSGDYTFRLAVDYFAYIYANGECVSTLMEAHGDPLKEVPVTLPLQAGENIVCLVMHAGSMGAGFRLEYPNNRGISIEPIGMTKLP
ncbi:MAG: SGNH/GDSL hydrolase family protein [Verrucomicrobiota bacterium JB024]|nr:SGNH/GDSL hydrolase family protein [Verrucomicrobiota bacterium JB024]